MSVFPLLDKRVVSIAIFVFLEVGFTMSGFPDLQLTVAPSFEMLSPDCNDEKPWTIVVNCAKNSKYTP